MIQTLGKPGGVSSGFLQLGDLGMGTKKLPAIRGLPGVFWGFSKTENSPLFIVFINFLSLFKLILIQYMINLAKINVLLGNNSDCVAETSYVGDSKQSTEFYHTSHHLPSRTQYMSEHQLHSAGDFSSDKWGRRDLVERKVSNASEPRTSSSNEVFVPYAVINFCFFSDGSVLLLLFDISS
jgi:hypothetical protein